MVRIYVERCWGGGDRHYFRLTMPTGEREHVPGERWCRQIATEALDLLEHAYGYSRKAIRFIHR